MSDKQKGSNAVDMVMVWGLYIHWHSVSVIQ